MALFGLTQDDHDVDKEVVDLFWNETSGVDDPGNLQPGWAVMKAVQDANLAVVTKAVETEEAIYQSLTNADLSHAPDGVRQAAGQLVTWLRQEGHGLPAVTPAAAPQQPALSPVASAFTPEETGLLRGLFRKLGLSAAPPATPAPPPRAPEEQDEQDLETIASIVADEWPTFVEKIPAILALPDADRAPALTEAVAALQTEVEAQYDLQQPITKASRTFSDALRQKYAKQGIAMADGSYPIPDVNALKRAIKSYGRNPTPAVKAHIMRRARALGRADLIPDTWRQAA